MLNVNNLHVSYGQSEALHGITFSAKKNETVAIMGRNGMGKTTLFKSLIGILPLKSGTIDVDGLDISKDESYQRVAKGVAYVPQGRMIFPTLTVQENILTGLENAKHKQIPDEIYALFPVLFDMRRPQGRQPVGRPAAAAGDCPRAGDQSQGAAAGRADRGHTAFHHQGHRARAQRDPQDARNHDRGVGAGAELRDGRGRPAVRDRGRATGA
jgi:ABC-type sugar transport system ATPase subunit